jgi:hypothetical protein
VRTITVTVLLTLALAAPAEAVVRASGAVLDRAGGGHVLRVDNVGDETIKCMRYETPNGEVVTSVSGFGSPAAFGPGFGAQGFELAPGSTLEWSFATAPAIPAAGSGGKLDVSSQCVPNSDVSSSVSRPRGAGVVVEMTSNATGCRPRLAGSSPPPS